MPSLRTLLFLCCCGLTLAASEIELFSTSIVDRIRHYSLKNSQGAGDLLPNGSIENLHGEPFYRLRYTGTQGRARSNITVPEDADRFPGRPKTLVLRIHYPDQNNLRLRVALSFRADSQALLVGVLTLEPGTHDYPFQASFKRGAPDPNLTGLSSILLDVDEREKDDTFLIGKIFLQLQPRTLREERTLSLSQQRKIQPIYPVRQGGLETLDFNPDTAPVNTFYLPAEDREATPEHINLRLGYDDTHLYIRNILHFPDAPPRAKAQPDRHADQLWNDALTEIFFSKEGDHQCHIQYVYNAAGTDWQALTAFDVTAAAVQRNARDWRFPHEKLIRGNDQHWDTTLKIPLDAICPPGQRWLPFQFAQNFAPGPQCLVWSPTRKYPLVSRFGLLVLNRTAAPLPPLRIEAVTCQEFSGSSRVDFLFTLAAHDWPSDTPAFITLAAPDNSVERRPVTLRGPLVFHGGRNLNGTYTAYIEAHTPEQNVQLCAVNFVNDKQPQDLAGTAAIYPRPKSMSSGAGTFEMTATTVIRLPENATPRTETTARLIQQKLAGLTGLPLPITRQNGSDGILLTLAENGGSPLRPEGYSLEITPERIALQGHDEAGLFYATVTLMQLLQAPLRHNTTLPVLTISDHPDLPVRSLNLNLPWQFHNRPIAERRNIDFLIDYLEKYVVNSKQNAAILDLSSLIQYESQPELNGTHNIYSLDDLEKLGAWARNHFLDIIPKFQIASHADWWLVHARPELRETGYRTQADVTHPEHNRMVFACLREVIQALQANYVHLGGDEWWHKADPDNLPPLLLRGKTRADAFFDFYREAAAFCRDLQVRPIIHEDMLVPWHNGHRYDVYQQLDRLPRDYIIAVWAHVDRNNRFFHEKGFEVWDSLTNPGTYPAAATVPLIKGYGINVYAYNTMRVSHRISYAVANMAAADFAWNAFASSRPSLPELLAEGYLNAAHHIRSVRPNPAGTGRFTPIPMSRQNLQPWPGLPSADQSIAGISMRLEGAVLQIQPRQEEQTIPLQGHLASLVFLHTLTAEKGYLEKSIFSASWRQWHYGEPAGDYIIVYADGSSATLPLRLQHTIGMADAPMLAGLCLDCRYTWAVRLDDGNTLLFYQLQWVNPFPEKIVQKLIIRHDNRRDFTVALAAVSAEQARPQP